MTEYKHLPHELKERGLFCCWRYENTGRDKPAKIPYNPLTGGRARSNDEKTFCDWASALAKADEYSGLGVGIFHGISALDIDHCVDENGKISDFAQDIIETMDSYTEYSPSGTGIRILFRTESFGFDKARYYINNDKTGLEVYVFGATNKYVTVTGRVIRDTGLNERDAQLQEVLDKFMKRPASRKTGRASRSLLSDESVLEKAAASKNGETFSRLWNGDMTGFSSQSEADMALAGMLAFWCGRDMAQMDRLFRRCGLMRAKWDRAQSGSTYGALTLEKAAGTTVETYTPCPVNATLDASGDARLAEMRPESNPRYAWTDIGASRLFADFYKETARYVPERKLWFHYDGRHWVPDVGNLKTMEHCKKLADALLVYAVTILDERQRNAYIDYCRRWQLRRYRETIIKDAMGTHPIAINEFDQDPHTVNFSNGTLFLKTMEFRPHCSGDKLTKITNAKYDREARSERWERFIDEIMCGDKEKALFLQKAMGYGLSGDTRYECLFIFYGVSSRNGKGTLCESVLKALGDYGCASRPETISLKQHVSSANPSEDIARLAGIRFCNIPEPGKGLVLNTAQVKSMTGGDSVNARFLFENSFDFIPQFKIFINTNYLPIINDQTVFSSGRVVIIPFEKHFCEEEQDKSLKREFAKAKNQSAILGWLITGYKMLEKEGLTQPDAVRAAIDIYRHDSDKIVLFAEEALVSAPNGEERTSEVYAHYQRWCTLNGYYCENARNFKQSLSAVARVERKRPRTGGSETTLLIGYKLTGEDGIVPL